uniref:Uncharacterized protein n=1 Tax=Trichogramma kaykai TaxID=54128 RepID=A0ABD2W8G0_9HYME
MCIHEGVCCGSWSSRSPTDTLQAASEASELRHHRHYHHHHHYYHHRRSLCSAALYRVCVCTFLYVCVRYCCAS